MQYCRYHVLNIDQVAFSKLDINDEFFTSLKNDYTGFKNWFEKKQKTGELAYVYQDFNHKIEGFLYLKVEQKDEKYDFNPPFPAKIRLKIGTFKVTKNGYKMGERFLKIAFDNALLNKVEEIFVTIFENNPEKIKLINILKTYGFIYWGKSPTQESIYVKKMMFDKKLDIVQNYPWFNYKNCSYFLLPLKPEFHTNLLPDCILKNEAPENFKQNLPWQCAIKKVYIGDNLYQKKVAKGDIILFYRTNDTDQIPAKFRSVVTGIGIILEKNQINLNSPKLQSLINRSVFKIEQIKACKNPNYLEFLFLSHFDKRVTLGELRDNLNLFNGPDLWGPRGLYELTKAEFNFILERANYLKYKEIE